MAKRKTDKQGRVYARLSDLKPGDKVEADGDFTCIKKGAVLTVERGYDGGLYVPCSAGGKKHFLDDQLDDDGNTLIGLYPVTA